MTEGKGGINTQGRSRGERRKERKKTNRGKTRELKHEK